MQLAAIGRVAQCVKTGSKSCLNICQHFQRLCNLHFFMHFIGSGVALLGACHEYAPIKHFVCVRGTCINQMSAGQTLPQSAGQPVKWA